MSGPPVLSLLAGVLLTACAGMPQTPQGEDAKASAPPELKAFSIPVPPAATSIEMVPVPAPSDGSLVAFYLSRTEVPWEVFDVFVYRLDEEAGQPAIDAVSRPSKPYLPPDRGFGHDGYPAISVSFKAANEFCAWLSARSGLRVRLPTEAEWEHASAGTYAAPLPDCAWFEGNSGGTTHPVGTRLPSKLGLCDMFGNAAEWVRGRDGKPVTKGGSYRDSLDKLTSAHRAEQMPSWNASDPQIPKSQWWLSDGPFVGFRIVCEAREKP